MTVSIESLDFGGQEVEFVNSYIYLVTNLEIEDKNYTFLGCLSKTELCIQSKNINITKTVFNQCVFPLLTYGAKTLTLTTASARKLRITQRKMVPSMLGENLRRRTGVSDVISQISFKWNWAGHVAPMTAGRWTKIWLEREPIEEVEEDRSQMDRRCQEDGKMDAECLTGGSGKYWGRTISSSGYKGLRDDDDDLIPTPYAASTQITKQNESLKYREDKKTLHCQYSSAIVLHMVKNTVYN